MKKVFRLFSLVLAVSLAFTSCSDSKETDDPTPTYSVTVTADENGAAKAEPAEAEAGKSVTLTATANKGFIFEKWTVVSGGVTLSNATANPIAFTMPRNDVAFKASFVEDPEPEIEDILELITDEAFKAYAQKRMTSPESFGETQAPAWDADNDGKLSAQEAAAVSAINLAESKARDLSALKYFPNVTTLNIDYCKVEGDVLDLTVLPKLTSLSCEEMGSVKSIDLTACTELITFYGPFNGSLTKLDFSKCGKLTSINIESCGAEGFTINVSGCKSLETLEAFTSNLSAVDLSGCTNLVSVFLNYAPVKSVDASNLPNLETLSLFECSDVQSINVSGCEKLEYLSCSNSKITSLNLTGLKSLRSLSVAGSPLSALDLAGLANLEELYCNNCKLKALSVKGCKKLWNVVAYMNYISEFDMTDMAFFEGDPSQGFTLSIGLQTTDENWPTDGSRMNSWQRQPFVDKDGNFSYDWFTPEVEERLRTDVAYWKTYYTEAGVHPTGKAMPHSGQSAKEQFRPEGYDASTGKGPDGQRNPDPQNKFDYWSWHHSYYPVQPVAITYRADQEEWLTNSIKSLAFYGVGGGRAHGMVMVRRID